MVVQLLQPFYLWGLLGLLVPLLIHLLHKRSRRVVKVGSLQAFRGGTPVQARRLQPNELMLLLLRCLLLALFVLLLCQPVIVDSEVEEKQFLFIAPELAATANSDSLLAAGIETRLLQPGLPLLQQGVAPDTSRYSYWDVFREIEGLEGLGDTVTLQFYPWLERFSGERPRLSRWYRTLPVPERQAAPQLVWALEQANNQLLMQWWGLEEGLWRIKSDTLPMAEAAQALLPFGPGARVQPPDSLRVLLQFDEAHQQEALRWQSALQFIDSLAPQTVLQLEQVPAGRRLSATPDVWIWLSEKTPPADFKQQAVLRLSLHKEGGNNWFRQNPEDLLHYYIQYSLQEQQQHRSRLAAFLPQLQNLLPLRQPRDVPPLLVAEAQWQPQLAATAAVPDQEREISLEYPLWLVLLLVFIIERWLSLRK